ncbi:cytokinin dehydrogenase [Musa troglodytarum]|uniref:Cytokinin dehydrogenase n=1 Tax=Musa troglodytarum TaxID=320322 RepID=A0A9E7G5V2_9LILI|nr:cytokinin dehydrogenase [Musa troglodytarum]
MVATAESTASEKEGWHFPTVQSSQFPTTQSMDILLGGWWPIIINGAGDPAAVPASTVHCKRFGSMAIQVTLVNSNTRHHRPSSFAPSTFIIIIIMIAVVTALPHRLDIRGSRQCRWMRTREGMTERGGCEKERGMPGRGNEMSRLGDVR